MDLAGDGDYLKPAPPARRMPQKRNHKGELTMKKFLKFLLVSFVLSTSLLMADNFDNNRNVCAGEKWFSAGRLLSGTLEHWATSDPANKLATATDLIFLSKWKNYKMTSEDIKIIESQAKLLVDEIDKVVEKTKWNDLKKISVTSAGSAAIVSLGNKLNPPSVLKK